MPNKCILELKVCHEKTFNQYPISVISIKYCIQHTEYHGIFTKLADERPGTDHVTSGPKTKNQKPKKKI